MLPSLRCDVGIRAGIAGIGTRSLERRCSTDLTQGAKEPQSDHGALRRWIDPACRSSVAIDGARDLPKRERTQRKRTQRRFSRWRSMASVTK